MRYTLFEEEDKVPASYIHSEFKAALYFKFILMFTVSISQQMWDDVKGVSNAAGRGFDNVSDATKWCRDYINVHHPSRIAELRAQLRCLEEEMAAWQARL